MRIYNHEALSFDDVSLVPSGGVNSRFDVDLRMQLGNMSLGLPVISSPMSTVTEWEMAGAMGRADGLGIIHRYLSLEEQVEQFFKASQNSPGNIGVAIGYDQASAFELLVDNDAWIFCIDIANGHHPGLPQYIESLKKISSDTHIMAGNISTWKAYRDLSNAGADSVRVGIGGGSVCTTRLVSGHGVPTLASLMDISGEKVPTCALVADGGIRNTGDMVKAFAAGADAVMLGRYFADTLESPGKDNVIGGKTSYAGMASKAAQQWAGRDVKAVEGVSTLVDITGSVKDRVDAIVAGLGSGCSYSGVDRLKDLAGKARYVTLTQAGVVESRPHALSVS